MASILTEDLATSLAEIHGEIADDELTWKGQTVMGKVAGGEIRSDTDRGHSIPDGQFRASILKSRFTGPDYPRRGDAIAFAGTQYRVASIINKPTAPNIIITLEA
jgi:hypothetical protein